MIVHTAPLLPERFQRRYVLLYLQGLWQLQLCRHMFSQLPDIEWVVCIEADSATTLKLSETFAAPSNVTYIYHLHDVYLRLDVFSAVISTWAVPHRAHTRGILLYSACAQLGIPVFELQHGLFQVGVNYQERASIVGDGFYGAASALPVRNFHDKLLAWSGEGAIGYPGFFNLRAGKDAGYCLILSNMHWNIYGEIDQTLFFEGVLATVEAHPDIRFIWKPHPAEVSKRTAKYFKPASENAYANLVVMTNNVMAAQELTTEDLIRDCSYAISSISTVLMELEMYHKKVAVYAPAVASGLWQQLRTVSKFVYPGELLKLFPKLARKSSREGLFESGMLQPFSPVRLRQELMSLMPGHPPDKRDVARVIAPLLSK